MARIDYLDRQDLPPGDRDILARDINLFRALANSPKAARAFLALAHHIRHVSRLDSRLRELVILQVGYLSCSEYEYSHHIKIGHDFGVTVRDVERMRLESRGQVTDLEPVVALALKAAREMTLDGVVDEMTFSELRRHFDAELLVELMIVISFYNGVVRLLASLGIDVEESYEQYLDAHFRENCGRGGA